MCRRELPFFRGVVCFQAMGYPQIPTPPFQKKIINKGLFLMVWHIHNYLTLFNMLCKNHLFAISENFWLLHNIFHTFVIILYVCINVFISCWFFWRSPDSLKLRFRCTRILSNYISCWPSFDNMETTEFLNHPGLIECGRCSFLINPSEEHGRGRAWFICLISRVQTS